MTGSFCFLLDSFSKRKEEQLRNGVSQVKFAVNETSNKSTHRYVLDKSFEFNFWNKNSTLKIFHSFKIYL